MLSRLHVRNYVLIDSLEIDFPEGLVIITGQTGAGKSILLGALSLVMGGKADASMIAEGADTCVVEAEFEAGSDLLLKEVLEDSDIEWDGGHIIIRRTVASSGRSRSFVNDSPVQVQLLHNISQRLVDIHSQHQTQLLSDRQFQLDILDHFAGNMDLRARCSSLWRRLTALKSELKDIDERLQRAAAQKDYDEAQFRQLEAASLTDGELAVLEEEQKQLANAEEIKMCLGGVEELFTAASSEGGMMSVDAALKEAVKLLSKAGRFVPSALSLSERVNSCRHELDDILSEVSIVNSRTELSQDRLETVENRMSLIYGLMQKHGCHDEAQLIAVRDSLSETLYDSTQMEERRSALLDQISDVSSELDSVSEALHTSRMQSKDRFASSICESVKYLELPYAVFDVLLSDAPSGASGSDQIQFLFSASGRNPVDVAKCASGGEKSRIMLSLKSMMARYTNMPTMIFDEIDTGVSGSVADRMGSMICSMGEFMQVFAITHLPQVAAKGNAHYLVSKTMDHDTSKAVSEISRLSEQERVMELARMLSGAVLTEAAIENARSLLSQA